MLRPARSLSYIMNLSFKPLTKKNWKDLENLFGVRGACGGCWCMFWRISRKDFNANKGDGNRKSLKRIVEKGEITGMLAYDGMQPIGWCAFSPREKYPGLLRSKIFRSVDGSPVWSVSCFYIHKDYRKKGVSIKLLENVVGYCAKHGAKIVEGYPVEPRGAMPAAFVWTGLASAFLKAGFKEIIRRSDTRPLMRYCLSA